MSDQGNPFSEEEQGSSENQNNNNQPPSGDPASSSNDNPFADKLQGIVNENGEPKYRTVEDALEALGHSQKFIDTLKSEKKQLEEQFNQTKSELEKRESVEDVVKRLTGQQSQPQEPKQEDQPQGQGGLDEETIRNMIGEYFNQTKQQETEQSNFSKVQSALVEQYGDKAAEHIRTRAKELNTTPTELEKLARTNPQMALGLLGGGSIQSSAPSTPSQSTPKGQPQQELKRPEKSLLRGASNEDLVGFWRQVQDHTHKKYGIEN